jgi:hypothetical protein
MTRAEEYRARAEEAEKRASEVKDIEAKRIYLDMARQWREMATRAERDRW